jgi:hypothetical protein
MTKEDAAFAALVLAALERMLTKHADDPHLRSNFTALRAEIKEIIRKGKTE